MTKLKFSPHEKVWAVINDKVQSATVDSAEVTRGQGLAVVRRYRLICGNNVAVRGESEIAATKAELLEQL